MSSTPIRLDLLLLERDLASTRTKAQELIRAGKVKVNGRVVTRTGEKIAPQAEIFLLESEYPFVSRGGVKLEAALREFGIDVAGRRALDVGQSTGGFTHCLLLRGAISVVGVEVGSGQLVGELRSDSRVICLEKEDIRTLSPDRIAPVFDLFVVDLSFISLAQVLPHLPRFLSSRAEGVVLVKPQFEVGPEAVGSGGIVRDNALREVAKKRIIEVCQQNGFTVAGEMQSPITGGDGNVEYLLHLRRTSQAASF